MGWVGGMGVDPKATALRLMVNFRTPGSWLQPGGVRANASAAGPPFGCLGATNWRSLGTFGLQSEVLEVCRRDF